ncbi:DUF185-domain-containing protein [Daedalea quercina L-15889]|uniref:Protein arginine methyltransferase NDUFAF7 n=1 Tax=Daedalea quercina L-15889 TaxID=1314783 RepID=A0A165P9P1_9APHY|nr:DUF185-domain-containing protein [Daedalea quercina L-15889]
MLRSTAFRATARAHGLRVYARALACTSRRELQVGCSASTVSQHRPYVAPASNAITPIEKILLDTIKATGPISFGTYMQMCLSHPTEGYYMKSTQQVFGEKGDFTTSPEISQVFGELVGVWLLSQWLYAGSSRRLRLVELGPGRGTLMHDILRVLSQFSAAREAIESIHLVENSPNMRQRQDELLSPLAFKHNWDLQWHASVDEVPHDPTRFTLLVAHEFFDALPFNLIQKTQGGWKEVMIAPAESAQPSSLNPTSLNVDTTLNPSRNPVASPAESASRFRRVLSSIPTASSTLLGLSSARFKDLPAGSLVEISPTAFKIARKVGELMHGAGHKAESSAGSALIVDYGGEKAFGNSFRVRASHHCEASAAANVSCLCRQAFKEHKIVDVFHRPGECDLTVNVDFAYLKEALAGVATPLGPLTQETFLTRMGIAARVDALRRSASSEQRAAEIEKAANRLVDKTGMGSQYQVMGVVSARADESSVRAEERWPFI